MNTSINSFSAINSTSLNNLQNLDLETALLAIQSQRAGLLESQLKDQMDEVKARNNTIAKGNDAMSELRNLGASLGEKDKAKLSNVSQTTKDTLATLGIELPNKSEVSKTELTALVEEIKGKLDAESNNQQMDMLRLQSLSNKRNEAFDVMTNFIKKMNDGRSSVVANMR